MARKLDAQAIANITKRMLAVPQEVKKAAEAELERTANMMADGMRRDVRAYAYEDGDLHGSIKVVRVDDEAGQIVYRVQAGGEGTTRREGRRPYDYALAVEYGTQNSPARPFFWPNYRQNRRKARAALTKVMRKAAKDLAQK
ncbi:HK97-gp10 family putative phage morphogenesis protein [Brevundimonas naejangsanensis]|uniref:HK97-gp10 family putative phage morphogenesis protein n=1 Tax=Brevundimonas naejangsanensis TaxID=588932 RepID=UPI0026ECC531|nr:HK97-gp10 family putative phage morphogenesis protein [Brevundimonas naejangsanensis]